MARFANPVSPKRGRELSTVANDLKNPKQRLSRLLAFQLQRMDRLASEVRVDKATRKFLMQRRALVITNKPIY
jgi:hypothetical protein